jgi:flavin-dependent thymidylate synthase
MNMQVNLVEFTGKGSENETWRAAHVMIWSKHTRVEMGPGSLEAIEAWPDEKKMEELAYMANTIPSSWEFCDYTFMIRGVTRALTHQLVRARTMSFAQQTMQILDMSQGAGWTYEMGPTLDATNAAHEQQEPQSRQNLYQSTMAIIADSYAKLVASGAKIEDARNLLPTGIHTNIVMKTNLRSLVQLVQSRESPRNLGEIVSLMKLLKEEVYKAHPWASLFFERTSDLACREMDEEIKKIPDHVVPPGFKTHLHKLVDQARKRT